MILYCCFCVVLATSDMWHTFQLPFLVRTLGVENQLACPQTLKKSASKLCHEGAQRRFMKALDDKWKASSDFQILLSKNCHLCQVVWRAQV